VVLVSHSGLVFGTLDDIQKLQVQKIPLGEAPYRLAYQESTHSIVGYYTY